MLVIRFSVRLGEAGAFPIATRSLARWMRPTERGFAQGVTHAGSRLGAALTPPIVVSHHRDFGWRAAFLVFGIVGLSWAAVWFLYYRDTPGAAPGRQRRRTRTDRLRPQRSTEMPWRKILSHSNLWILR